jgi:Tol biopolymer transport system component
MALAAGTRLGPYEITAPLGAGGMGEVYRARDTRLGRDVAVKVLPQQLMASGDARARFEREARTISSLNHPGICTLHDVGRDGETDYLVMELVDGETLARRLSRGALPVPEVLRLGSQIAEALDRAHRAGVIHRDLKPGNVMLTRAGIKLMDFGLARGVADAAAPDGGPTRIELSRSPTVATPLTAEGTIMGTFQYMAPEQLEGGEADARSDLWALGCVLYEMATGRRAFEGKSQASLIAAIMNAAPPSLTELAPMTPPALDRTVRQCLAKDPDERWQTAGDLRRELSWIANSGAMSEGGAASGPARRRWLPAGLASLALLAGVLLGWLLLPPRGGGGHDTSPSGLVTAMVRLTDSPGIQQSPRLSPDGKMLLYVSLAGGDEDIFLLRVGGENPINLTETHSGSDFDPSFSPDGERIAFCSSREGGGIFVMGATGESPRKLASEGAHPEWAPDGRKIAYTTERILSPYGRNLTASLWLVDVGTGERKRIYEGDAAEAVWSPSGRRIAFWAADRGQRDIRTVDAEGRDLRAVTQDVPADWGPFWSPDGRSLFFLSDRGGGPDLWRVAIDEGTGRVRGDPEPVTTGVARVMAGSISADGKRIAVTVEEARGEILRMGFDPVSGRPRGQPMTLFESASALVQLSLSADGSRIAYRTSGVENLFAMRSDGAERRRLTDDAFRDRGPQWVRGNELLLFYSNREGNYSLWLIRADGTGLRKVAEAEVDLLQPRLSPDQTRLAVSMSGLRPPQLGMAPVSEDWLAPGGQPEPISFDSLAVGFIPLAWSPDGSRIVGTQAEARGTFPAVFTLATKRVEGHPDLQGLSTGLGFAWLPDGRRVLGWDAARNTATLWNVDTGAVEDVPGIPGTSELRLSADGRTLLINRTIQEGDIWLMTLK